MTKTQKELDELRLYGDPRFYTMLDEMAELHSNKNHDYAAGGDPLGNFKRVANILSQYPGLNPSDPTVVALTYAMKQLDASLTLLSTGLTAKVEGFRDRMKDVAAYAMLSMLIEQDKADDAGMRNALDAAKNGVVKPSEDDDNLSGCTDWDNQTEEELDTWHR